MTCRQKDRFLRLTNQRWHTLSLSIWNVGIKALAPMIILVNWLKSSWTEKEERSQEANENLSYLNYFEVFRTCLLENTFLNWTHVCNYATRGPFSWSNISQVFPRASFQRPWADGLLPTCFSAKNTDQIEKGILSVFMLLFVLPFKNERNAFRVPSLLWISLNKIYR